MKKNTWLIIILSIFVRAAEPGDARAEAPLVYQDGASGVEVEESQIPTQRPESPEAFDARMAWWREARFGVMITFGPFSVPAKGEWVMRWEKIPVAEYRKYADQLTLEKFDPDKWVRLFKEAGARYIVLIAKHHDGFALWPSKASPWNIVDASPYGKDMVGPLADACRKHGLKFGIYYSQAQDWVHPGGAVGGGNAKPWDPAQEGDFDEYIDKIAVPQIRELAAYKPDVFWWDTPVNITKARAQRLIAPLLPLTNLIMNGRLGGVRSDYDSAEQSLPTYAMNRDWEACITLGSKWSYATSDKQKPIPVLIRTLAETVSKGGNLIYGFGPRPDGTFIPEHVERLKAIGAWLKRNGEAIYGCTAGPFPYLSYGCATRKGNQLNLIVIDWPKDGLLRVPLLSEVKVARLAGTNTKLDVVREAERVVVKVPAEAPDPVAGVVVLEVDGEPIARPNPNELATVKCDGHGENMADILSFKMKGVRSWITPDGTRKAVLDFSFAKPVNLSAVRMEEPRKWPRFQQAYTLEAKMDGAWKTLAEATTDGNGTLLAFEPVTTSALRLKIVGQNRSPGMGRVLFISPE